jgi:organic hydroperoxide reductase OsmC/OhrA
MAALLAVPETQKTAPRVAPFPHLYRVRLDACETGAVLLAPPRPLLLGGAPAEFGGSDDRWSPEHLLLASASLCLRETFGALAQLKHLAVESYQADAHALLDRTATGPAFAWIKISVDLRVAAGEVERARALLEKAKEHCIVANSLKTPVLLDATVTGV